MLMSHQGQTHKGIIAPTHATTNFTTTTVHSYISTAHYIYHFHWHYSFFYNSYYFFYQFLYTRDASQLRTCCFQTPCESSPCKNGGICQSGYTDKGYRCVCHWGFSSSHCEKGITIEILLKEIYLLTFSQRYRTD